MGRRRAAAIGGALLVAQLLTTTLVAAATPQSITFTLPAAGLVGDDVTLTGTASSGLPVSYASETPTICDVSDTTLTLLQQGTCRVGAGQAGNEEYLPAAGLSAEMLVQLTQVISFDLPTSGVVGATVTVDATASSGLVVTLLSTTPSVCTLAGSTLSLKAAGECSMTASQSGDEAWVGAETVSATMLVTLPPFTSPDGASIGRFAFNGVVRTLVLDESTGITYVGGDFTEVGVRTGAVAVVDPPGSGSDKLDASTPDVVGSSIVLLRDDATGYFMTGAIGSINGDGVHRRLVRMTAAGDVDPTWSASDPCSTGAEPRWDLGDRLAAPVDTGTYSTMGLMLIDKDDGTVTFAGSGASCGTGHRTWGSVGVLPALAACAGWNICAGYVFGVAEDDARHLLFTEFVVISRQTLDNVTYRIRHYLVAYDTVAGTRLWSRELESASKPAGWPVSAQWEGQATSMIGLDGAVLLVGRFPLDSSDPSAQSHMLLVDEANGAILQRWNAGGEQDLADPASYVAPPTPCTPAHASGWDYVTSPFVRLTAATGLGYAGVSLAGGELEATVCTYGITGTGAAARLAASVRGSITDQAPVATAYALPSVRFGSRYVAGPYGAFDLNTNAAVAGWDPEPSGMPLSIVATGNDVVLGGNVVFLHGAPASHVAALDPALSPIPGFTSGLVDTELSASGIQEVRDLGLVDGRLLVAGDLKGDFGRGPVATLDLASGDLLWGRNEANLTIGNAIAVDGGTGAFYLGMGRFDAGPVLSRFVPSGQGFAVDGSFTHAFGAFDGARWLTSVVLAGTHLYVGGSFASVDGQARQGLARLTNGVVDAWDPRPITELDVDPGDTAEIQPAGFLERNGDVVVIGGFVRIITEPGSGGGITLALPSVLVYDGATADRVKPVGTNEAWYPDPYGASDMVVLDNVIYVAMGGTGVAAFDGSTFAYLASRSTRTQPGWSDNMLIALGVRTADSPTAPRPTRDAAALDEATAAETAAATQGSSSLVVGGDLGHWSNVSAGNVVELLPSERLTISRAGSGRGTVTSVPAGIACGSTCSGSFPVGTSVKLTATPVTGATFTGWSGGGCSGTSTCTVSMSVARTVTATFADKARPTVGSLAIAIRSGVSLSGTAIPLRMTWVGADTGGSGVKRYEVARSTDGGSTWTTLTTSLAVASYNVTPPSSGSIRYRVRAIDYAANYGAWATAATVQPRLVQQSSSSIVYAKTWTTVTNASCSGGSARYSGIAGASATLTFYGRAVGFVTTAATSRGQAKVYVNGALVTTIDLRASTSKFRFVAWQMRWSTLATRTVRIVVVGTSGRPRVDVDAFATLR